MYGKEMVALTTTRSRPSRRGLALRRDAGPRRRRASGVPAGRVRYYGYRYYAAQLGRWISRDPAAGLSSSDLFGFLRNNPLNESDLLGLTEVFVNKDGGPVKTVIDIPVEDIGGTDAQDKGEFTDNPVFYDAAGSRMSQADFASGKKACCWSYELRVEAGGVHGIAHGKKYWYEPHDPYGNKAFGILGFEGNVHHEKGHAAYFLLEEMPDATGLWQRYQGQSIDGALALQIRLAITQMDQNPTHIEGTGAEANTWTRRYFDVAVASLVTRTFGYPWHFEGVRPTTIIRNFPYADHSATDVWIGK